MANEISIENMAATDWPEVRRVYEEGIATGNATFESEPPSWEAWDESHLAEPRLVARAGGTVVGWAALMPVSQRAVYRGVADVSIYVAEARRGRGVGSALLSALLERSEAAGIWTLQAGIFPENPASIGLHSRFGFRTVGVRERIGHMGGVWRDILLLERRSPKVR